MIDAFIKGASYIQNVLVFPKFKSPLIMQKVLFAL